MRIFSVFIQFTFVKSSKFLALSSAANKAEALKLIRSSHFVEMEDDFEFLLEYHLVECNELESKITAIWKRLEHAEQSVSDKNRCILNSYFFNHSGIGALERVPKRVAGCQYFGNSFGLCNWVWRLCHWSLWNEFRPN